MHHRAALVLMVASGFAGLGYQVVWTQQGALWLGHEAAAVLAVVTAFFGGLGTGALALSRRIERSSRPERWYAGCELAIALWGLVLAGLLAPISDWMLELTGAQPSPIRQWCVAFFGSYLVLLPATAAMGATLPAMERVCARLDLQTGTLAGRFAGRYAGLYAALYAGNTLGAVIGVLATAFWLVPELGLARTAAVCAALNVLCALAALTLSSASASARLRMASPAGAGGSLMALAATGLLGIGYEVLVVRVLSQVAEDTVYTFALLLAVYLMGSALGAMLYRRWGSASASDAAGAERLRVRLLYLQAAACLFGTAALYGAESVKAALQARLGSGMGSALALEATLALLAFGLPTVVMGALFSHLCGLARGAGHGFGRALGVNTLGAASAPLLFGVLLVPAMGSKASLLGVAAGYLALALPHARSQPLFSTSAGTALALATLALAVWAPPLAFVDLPEGGHVVSYREGVMAAVSVVEDADGVSTLRINNRQQEGSSATLLADARQALLPVLLHPAPRHALFLGLGTGMTASSAARDPTLQVDAAELLPEVIAASAHFTSGFDHDGSGPRLHVLAADARRFIRTTDQRYDVIVADNFHPARSGSGSLYTVEHFRAVHDRLADGGLFCQWLPLHQLDLDSLRSIVRSFIAVYPGGTAMLATHSLETPVLGLVGRLGGGRLDLLQLHDRVAHQQLSPWLSDFGIHDELTLLGGFVAGPASLARFAGAAPLNTDDRPVVAYRAPRITYAPDSMPRDRLVALLQALRIEPGELVQGDAASSRRLAAYWTARDQFIEAGRHVRPTADPASMLAQVREPLLAVLRTSPDFRPAFDPLQRMAVALQGRDPGAARALLDQLAQVESARLGRTNHTGTAP